MSTVVILFFLFVDIIVQGQQSANFYTFGDKFLYKDEGASITSISGYNSVIDISREECAEGCLTMQEVSGCCNSFTYNPFRRECYLKLKPQSSSEEVVFNNDGWQTYIFENKPGSSLVGSVEALYNNFQRETNSYNHKGMNQLAVKEGNDLLTADNKVFLQQVTPDECAEACNNVNPLQPGQRPFEREAVCNSFSYNPNLSGGTCYLKQNSDDSRAVTYNSDGWRTYWRGSINDCFETCKSDVFCVICIFENDCFER